MYVRLVTVLRLLLGADLSVNGLNWWVKLITPYPSISDFAGKPLPPDFIGAMIETGFLFHIVKGLELLAGVALLANRFVPLALVAVFPVSVSVFLIDWFLAQTLRAYVMGTGELLMNVALLLAYLDCYRPMLGARAQPDHLAVASTKTHGDPVLLRLLVGIRPLLLPPATAIGSVMLVWILVMIVQRAVQ